MIFSRNQINFFSIYRFKNLFSYVNRIISTMKFCNSFINIIFIYFLNDIFALIFLNIFSAYVEL